MPVGLLLVLLVLLVCGFCADVLAGATEVAAGAVDLSQLTLTQAQALLLAHSRELKTARTAVESAEADRIAALARPNPTLSVNTSSINTRTGIGAGSLGDKQMDSIIRVDQLFERGGKRELRSDAAQFSIEASRGDLADAERQQRKALSSAYYDLALAQEKSHLGEDNAALFQKTMDAAAMRLKAGDVARADAARIGVDALRAANDARLARAEREKAQVALAYLIGMERRATEIRAVDAWPSLETTTRLDDVDALIDRRADVRAAGARVQAAQKAWDLARALRTRDITVGIQYEHFLGDTHNNTYGVGVSVPLFLGYAFEGEIRRADAALTAARDNLDRTRAVARGEVARALADLDAATERISRFDGELLKQADQAAGAAEFAYSHGAVGVMDLLDARRTRQAIRIEAATAHADYAKTLAAWRAAVTDAGQGS
jgi:cobalt-zinc-cadmium efflux system outer membrane protein